MTVREQFVRLRGLGERHRLVEEVAGERDHAPGARGVELRAPLGVELPRLASGDLVPGVYGKVTADNVMTYVLQDDDGQTSPVHSMSLPATSARSST